MNYYKLTSPESDENIYMQGAFHPEFYNTDGLYLSPDDIERSLFINFNY